MLVTMSGRRPPKGANPRQALRPAKVGPLGFRPAEVTRPESYVTAEDLHDVSGIAAEGERRQHLLELRASHSALQELPPVALAILGPHFCFRLAPEHDADDSASVGFQLPVREWQRITGYSERAVQYGFRWLVDAGLLGRYADFVSVGHLTRNRPEEERLDAWTDGRGKERRFVQVYSRTYLTRAGAALLERAGFDSGPLKGGRRGWHRAGWLGRLLRLTGRLWRTVRRRLGLQGPSAVGAQGVCTPLPATQGRGFYRAEGDSQRPASGGAHVEAVSRPRGETNSEYANAESRGTTLPGKPGRAEGVPYGPANMGGASAKPGCSTSLPLAHGREACDWLGLTAEGLRDGLSWEGGGLVEFAETVERCWTRTVDALELVPDGVPRRTENLWGRVARVGRCRGCGATAPRVEGWPTLHAGDCPAVGTWRLKPLGPWQRPGRTWAPAATAEQCWPKAWAQDASARPMLLRWWRPVAAELARRIQARAAELRQRDDEHLLTELRSFLSPEAAPDAAAPGAPTEGDFFWGRVAPADKDSRE